MSTGMPEQESLHDVRTLFHGRYTVERELGQGGMATVYLAEEIKHKRPVAIKVMRPEVSPALGAERFLREIGIAARLSHPHLVPLIDSGETGGLLYYVSAYLPGGSLRERLAIEGRLGITDALRITEEVGTGLDFAHRAGFVHRDVKPENILFADGHAMLTDFGIARASCPEDGRVTGAGFAVGTPTYMSPEQASGEQRLDARSDVYSLACVLYEMVTGKPPFSDAPVRVIIAKHVTEIPVRVRTIRPEVPLHVDAAIARALAKDPANRFDTVGDFTAALRSPTAGSRILAIATRSIAVLPFVNASPDPENEYLSDGITDELIDALAKVDGIRIASRTSVFALKGKPHDVRAIGALLDCGVVLEGTVRRAGSRLRVTAQLTSTDDGRLLWSQRFERQIDDVFAMQDEIAGSIVDTLRANAIISGGAPHLKRHTESIAAYRLYLKGRYEWNRRTQEGIVAGIGFFKQAIAEDPNYALAYTGLADCYALEVDYRSVPVREGFEAAKRYARRAIELDDSLAEAHASLAWSLFIFDWDWEGAAHEFLRAIELDPRYATAHQWYAFLLVSRGRLDEALVEAHTAVELDPGSVSARRSLSWCYFYSRRYEQARYHLERAVAMNPTSEESYRFLGMAVAMTGDHDGGIRLLEEASTMAGSGSYTRSTLGYVLARAGRTEGARAILGELESQAQHGYVSPVAFATILLALGEVERALDWAERGYEERRGWMAYLRVNPIMDPIRGHPRFDALLAKMRL
jgi:eukaryotic-like serine/threonine-protein kinase